MASTQEPSILVTSRNPGEPVQNLDLFTRAWGECIELQVSACDEWVGRSLLSLQGLRRYEIAAVVDCRVVGGIVVADDPWDAHVGPCMSVFAQYVMPDFRLRGISPRLMREALRIAKRSEYSVLAFTHRKAPWRYETIYRKV